MKNNLTQIKQCRISGSKNLISVLNLGSQVLTGVFPKNRQDPITTGPLELVWCPDSGLLQLHHSYDLGEMYGMNYGYRSGLNQTMVQHLRRKVDSLLRICPLYSGDIVLDIGSNDATLLSAYSVSGLNRIGIDPTGNKFSAFYGNGIELIPDFFTAEAYKFKFGNKKAKLITSIAMFYDLESPSCFVSDIAEVLDDEGIWHFEQSYMPTMLRMNSYDTVCHEHLEYYSLRVIKDLVEKHDLMVVDVQMNAVNGGSFAVTVAKKHSTYKPNNTIINWLLGQEDRMGLHTPKPYRDFEDRVYRHRDDLTRLIRGLRADNKRVVGYGASTKGNVLLQFCGFTEKDIECIAEVNSDKFGSYTPGTHIPILSESEVHAMKPDYMLVLPWHFRDSIVRRESNYLTSGGKLIFPMPEIEII
ncbi:MAG: class I SAM-dependent methyltransferase [Methylococcaceae bacterium]